MDPRDYEAHTTSQFVKIAFENYKESSSRMQLLVSTQLFDKYHEQLTKRPITVQLGGNCFLQKTAPNTNLDTHQLAENWNISIVFVSVFIFAVDILVSIYS